MFFTKLPLLALTSLLSLSAGSTEPAPTTEAAKEARAGRRQDGGICGRIECSDSQEASLAKIVNATKEKLRAAHGKKGDHRSSLAAAMRDSSLTRDEAAAAIDRENGAEVREAIMVDAFMQIHAVLDESQRAELATMIENRGMHALMGGHHGKGAGKDHGRAAGKLKAKDKDDRGPGSLKAKKNGKPRIDDKANGKSKGGGKKAKHTSVGSLRAARG